MLDIFRRICIIVIERGRTRMDKTVTLEDVARAAGVGKGTVDRVLHNRGRVAEKTRERVLACIEELKYLSLIHI